MRLDLELRTDVTVTQEHRPLQTPATEPRLNNGFLSTMNSRITERILSIEKRNPLDSEPSRNITHTGE